MTRIRPWRIEGFLKGLDKIWIILLRIKDKNGKYFGLNYFKGIGINYMYSEEHEDPLYTKLSKILELTSLIFGHYKETGQKERAHSLIVWVVSALQAVIENRQKLYIARPFTPETVRLAYMRAKANATSRYYIIPEAP